jgi:hypothetical protein
MPLIRYNRYRTRLNLMCHLIRLPALEARIPTRVTRSYVLSIRTERYIDTIPRIIVPTERLLAVLAEALGVAIDDDLVVRGLEGGKGFNGMVGGTVYTKYVWFGDEFNRDGYIILPSSEGLVVRRGDLSKLA